MSFNILDFIDKNIVDIHETSSDFNDIPMGQIAVLSVGHGDMKITFDSDDEAEIEKARTVVLDMLKRGYMIFIEVDGEQTRVTDFDPKTNEYIIKLDKRSKTWRNRDKSETEEPKKPKKQIKRVDAKTTRGTAIAPTGGG